MALLGCGKKDDAISQAAKKDVASGVPAPSVREVKAIAEEGFIYGLPLVMNYGVMYQFVIDKNSGQWKAPFNTIYNEHRVFTPEDTAISTPNSDTPYSLLWMDLRAEPMVISVPTVDKKRYYSVMLVDGNTFNYGYIGSRAMGSEAGDYLVVGPRWKGDTPAGIKKVFNSTTDFSLASSTAGCSWSAAPVRRPRKLTLRSSHPGGLTAARRTSALRIASGVRRRATFYPVSQSPSQPTSAQERGNVRTAAGGAE